MALLTDDPRIAGLVADEASASGAVLVTVHSGPAYHRVNGSTFILEPHTPEDYRLLLDTLHEELGPVAAVLHAWEVGPPAESELTALHRGPLALLTLLQALTTDPVPLLVLTTNGVWARPGDQIVPVRSTLPGLVRTALTEAALPLVRQVDLPARARTSGRQRFGPSCRAPIAPAWLRTAQESASWLACEPCAGIGIWITRQQTGWSSCLVARTW